MTIAATPGDPPAATPPAELPSSTGRPWLRRLLSAACLLLLFVLAYFGSTGYRSLRQRPHDSVDPAPVPAASVSDKAAKPANSAELLDRGDQALQRYRFAAALSIYAEFLEIQPAGSAIVDYRLGLCHESLGDNAKALAAYRQAISGAPTPAFSFACQLGMARCLLRQNEPGLARRLLYPTLLDEDRQGKIPKNLIADARYLAALAVGYAPGADKDEARAENRLASFSDIRGEVAFYFEELAAAAKAEPATAPAKSPAGVLTIQKGNDQLPTVVVCAVDIAPTPLEVLERLAAAGGLQIEWSDKARLLLSDAAVRVSVHQWTLPALIETTADYLDLVSKFDGNKVHITTRSETDNTVQAVCDRAMRKRALAAAVAHEVDHPSAAAAHLELGNEFAADGNLKDAAMWYGHAIRRFPSSPLTALALYNRAEVHVRSKEYPMARQCYFRVIDTAPGHEYSVRAYLRIGELHLAEEQPDQAIRQLRRAQSMAPHSRTQVPVTMTLAAAHLQGGDPASARAVLARHRTLLQREPHRHTAVFLDVYASYRLAKDSSALRRQSTDLLSTLEAAATRKDLGVVGDWLMAEAFRDLGLLDEAERMQRRAAAHAHGALADRIQWTLGDTLVQRGRRGEAAKVFDTLSATRSRYGPLAQLELARLDLHAKQFQPCLDHCRRLWANPSFDDKAGLLKLWGAAWEGLGDFAKASQCYAGKAPE